MIWKHNFLQNIHRNPDYPTLFRGRPLRFVLPLNSPGDNVTKGQNLIPAKFHEQLARGRKKKCIPRGSVLGKTAMAHQLPSGDIFVKPELLIDIGCETPRVNYESHVGKEYRYFYAISSDVDLDNPGTVSTETDSTILC